MVPWTPLLLADVLQYHDATNLASMGVSGGEATKWDDLGPRGNHLLAASASSAVYPAYEAAGLGTGPCIFTDGVGEWLRVAAASYGGTVGSYSLAMAMSSPSVGANQFCGGYASNGRPSLVHRTNQLRHVGAGGVVQQSVLNPGPAAVWVAVWDGATMSLYRNGTLSVGPDVNASAALANGLPFAVGATGIGTSFASIRCGLTLFTRGVMTAGEIANLQTYCASKGWV